MPRLSEAAKIKRMLAMREEIREIEGDLKIRKAKLKKMEDDAIALLLKKDMVEMATSGGTISINPETVAQVQNWDQVFNYIKKKDAFYLMFKRINNAAWREEIAANRNKPVPGIDPFERYKLSLRTNKR